MAAIGRGNTVMSFKGLIRGVLAAALLSSSFAHAASVQNNVIRVEVSGTRGGSIDSFRVLGTELIDVADLGREIQVSLFLNANQLPPLQNTCRNPTPPWLNPQDAGSECGVASNVYAINGAGQNIDVGVRPQEWHGRGNIAGLRIEGHHRIGPLAYLNVPEVMESRHQVYWDSAYAGQQPLQFRAEVGGSPVQFVPAAYFKRDQLSRIFGLAIDGSGWQELTAQTASTSGAYTPSLYRFRAMAWMRADLGYGVAMYSRSSMSTTCPQTYQMTLPAQQGQCPNYAAIAFPNQNVVNLSILQQGLAPLAVGTGVQRISHTFVGNLGTMQNNINAVFNSGN